MMKSLEASSSSGRSPDASTGEKGNHIMTVGPRFSPAGMKVLVVDDDPVCLMKLEAMMRKCSYSVTACHEAQAAWELLLENKTSFDLVISDVYMPGVDGFKLLKDIGLELDIPVIMMSANGDTDVVLKGITNGACGYLIKPVRIEELKTIWQHVVRKRGKAESFKDSHMGDGNESGRGSDSLREADENSKKRKEKNDSSLEDVSGLKKSRVNWSNELHEQFVQAVKQLGIDKAVPKRILEIMNVHGLSRENVASHLQKYRQYLKKYQQHPVVGVYHQPGNFCGGAMQMHQGYSAASCSKAGGMNIRLTGSGLPGLDQIGAPALDTFASFQARQMDRPWFSEGMSIPMANIEGLPSISVPRIAQLQGRETDGGAWSDEGLNIPMAGLSVVDNRIDSAALGRIQDYQIDECPWTDEGLTVPLAEANIRGPDLTIRASFQAQMDAAQRSDDAMNHHHPWLDECMNIPVTASNIVGPERSDPTRLFAQFRPRHFDTTSAFCEGLSFRQEGRHSLADQGVFCGPF